MRRSGVIRRYVPFLFPFVLSHTPGVARADLRVGSTARNGGALVVLVDRRTTARVSYGDALGDLTIYSATEPGFKALGQDGHLHPRFRLLVGTAVWIELVDAAGGGAAMKVRDTLLTHPGDRALLGTHRGPRRPLHLDPEYLLFLNRPPGRFGDATLAFRLRAQGYRRSRVYRIRLSNGHLPPVDLSPLHYDSRAIACQRRLGQRGLGLVRAAWTLLTNAETDTSATLDAAQAEAHADLVNHCGPAGSRDYDAVHLATYLDLASTHVAAMVAQAGEASSPTCRAALLQHGLAFVSTTMAKTNACLLAMQQLHATEAAEAEALRADPLDPKLPRRLAVRRAAAALQADIRCADAHRRGPDAETLPGRVLRARAQAAAAISRACGNRADDPDHAASDHFLRAAACGAGDLISAAFATAQADLAEQRTRRSQGRRPLSSYFACLAGGAE